MNWININLFCVRHDTVARNVYNAKRTKTIPLEQFKIDDGILKINETFMIDRMKENQSKLDRINHLYWSLTENLAITELAHKMREYNNRYKLLNLQKYLSSDIFSIRPTRIMVSKITKKQQDILDMLEYVNKSNT